MSSVFSPFFIRIVGFIGTLICVLLAGYWGVRLGWALGDYVPSSGAGHDGMGGAMGWGLVTAGLMGFFMLAFTVAAFRFCRWLQRAVLASTLCSDSSSGKTDCP